MSISQKKKNPLYVVTNNGVDVEEVKSRAEMLLKKLKLDALIPVIEAILQTLLAQVQSYAIFKFVKEFLDKVVQGISNMLMMAKMMA